MQAREFYRQVRENANLASDREAAEVTEHVLENLAKILHPHLIEQLQRQMPPELAAVMDKVLFPRDDLIDRQVFIGSLVNDLDVEYLYDQSYGGMDLVSVYADDDASQRVRAVFAGLKASLDTQTVATLRKELPPEIGDWFSESGGGLSE